MKQTLCVGCSVISLALGLGLDPAFGAGSAEYRIVGCSPAQVFSFPPPVPVPYKVTFSNVPGEIGLECEVVLSALGADGFKLIELRDEAFPLSGMGNGTFHYLERLYDDD